MPSPIVKMTPAFWQVPLAELFVQLQAGWGGLSSREAKKRLGKFGPNVIRSERKTAGFVQFLTKFRNPLVIILLVASALAALTGDAISFLIIAIIVLLSVTLDFAQEYRASMTAEQLRQSVDIQAQVLRDGQMLQLPVAALVPGDVVSLRAGDLVPGDGRLLEAKDFFVNQALLTGETYPVEKIPRETVTAADLLTADNTVLLGTSVVSGSAQVLLCQTGAQTSLGTIADTLTTKPPATAFEQGIQRFGLLIMRLTFLLVLFVILVNALMGRPWLASFLFALSLAVGLTPELLPMVVSVTLARGALRMADSKVIVKRLGAIHDLGSMDVLCTDKTGTLTEARIHLERHLDPFGSESEQVLELAYLNSYFETGLKSPLDDAILEHSDIDVSIWRKIDEVPFDFERRRISVLVDHGDHKLLVVKGAPEDLLHLSVACTRNEDPDPHPLDVQMRQRIHAEFESLSRAGFRVLGIASRRVPPTQMHAVVSDESDLVFAGFAAFFDPAKASAKSTLAALAADRIAVKMITGDNELVTRHLAEQLGLSVSGVLNGTEIQQMDDLALAARVENVNLFCRVTPIQKNRIILALKRRHHVVGYLGDGINDAPSLHSADVGISVAGAVDVAKAAADMILLEQDLAVLHAGVREGRRSFGNIMKYILMGTSSNFGNMLSMAGSSLFLPFLPMLPTQILLNNLLYDLSELPIPLDKVDEESLQHPRHWNMYTIQHFMLIIGSVSSLFDFLTFYLMLAVFNASEALFHTGWFVESIATQVLVIFVIRTRRNPLRSRPDPSLVAGALSVVAIALWLPYTHVGTQLGLVALPGQFFLILMLMLVSYLLTVEIIKRWFFRHYDTA